MILLKTTTLFLYCVIILIFNLAQADNCKDENYLKYCNELRRLQALLELLPDNSRQKKVKHIKGTTVNMYQGYFVASPNMWIKTEAVYNCRALIVITSTMRTHIAHIPPNANIKSYLPKLKDNEIAFYEIYPGPAGDLRSNSPELDLIMDDRFHNGIPPELARHKADFSGAYTKGGIRHPMTFANLAVSPYQKGKKPPFTILYEQDHL